MYLYFMDLLLNCYLIKAVLYNYVVKKNQIHFLTSGVIYKKQVSHNLELTIDDTLVVKHAYIHQDLQFLPT